MPLCLRDLSGPTSETGQTCWDLVPQEQLSTNEDCSLWVKYTVLGFLGPGTLRCAYGVAQKAPRETQLQFLNTSGNSVIDKPVFLTLLLPFPNFFPTPSLCLLGSPPK